MSKGERGRMCEDPPDGDLAPNEQRVGKVHVPFSGKACLFFHIFDSLFLWLMLMLGGESVIVL